MLVLSGAAIVVAAATAWLISRSIVRPIQRAVQAAKTMATGDLTQVAPARQTDDEAGRLIQALEELRHGFQNVLYDVRRTSEAVAASSTEISQGKHLISTSVQRVEQGSVLVNKAGATMTEVVSSIRRVTDLMQEISAASHEQATGVAQVGQAVSQMDQVTQQNGSVVVQMAMSASGMKDRTNALVQALGVFRLNQEADTGSAMQLGWTSRA